MNRNLFRIVFNRSRNTLMVVQETASSVSGASCAQTCASARRRCASPARAILRCVSWAVLWACGLSAMQPAALAQSRPVMGGAPAGTARAAAIGSGVAPALTASPTAPAGQRPLIDAAQNGVPIVHIAPPSAGGVSVNRFQDFNVGSAGLVENNSAGNVQTQLGGWIAGNPQLGYVPARIIVNEVAGTSQSVLKGTIEVAGRSADLIISNPNGLLVNGLGFINTSRATLTTGTPQYTSQGGLQGLSVSQGQISVGSGGLNAASLEQLDLIARGLVIEGQVWAQNLNVLAGANQVLYASLGATPVATAQFGAGPAPQFAIDIKDLGGMTANQIYLLATEQGLGVNSTGRIAALQGHLQLSVNGDLTLKDTYATRGMTLAGTGNMALTGQTQTPAPAEGNTGGDIAITAAGTLTNSGLLDSAGTVTLNAAALSNAGALIQLTHTETERIKQLANGDAQKEARLTAAACAMAHCADGVPTSDPSYAYLKGLQDAGAGMTAEQSLLSQQRGQVGRATQGLFTYDPVVDKVGDYLTQNNVGTRAGGTLQAVGGAGLIAAGSAGCTTGVGCTIGAAGMVVGVDNLSAGATTAWTGKATVTQGEQVLQSLGLSPQAAAITYAAVGITPAVVGGVIANNAASASLNASARARLSYTSEPFSPVGVQVTPAVMQSPQAKAVVGEYLASGASAEEALRYAKTAIASGTDLPLPMTVTADTELIKFVPKSSTGGDVVSAYSPFFVTRQEYENLVKLPASQIAERLGIPAEQGVRGSQLGFDVYLMKPIPNTTPIVFTSEVAPVGQGSYVASGGAQQVIVPNRSQWTDPNANKIGVILGGLP